MSKYLQAQVCGKDGKWRNVGRTYTTISAVNGYLRKYLSGRTDIHYIQVVNVETGTTFDYNPNREWIA
jgi:hypothetical protein